MTPKEREEALRQRIADYEAMENDGWICNQRGWWHPPSCVASWPFEEAREMWRKDRDKKRTVRK